MIKAISLIILITLCIVHSAQGAGCNYGIRKWPGTGCTGTRAGCSFSSSSGGCSVLTEFSDFYGAGANSSYLDCNSSRLVTFSGSNCDGAVLGNYTNGCYTTPYNGTSYTSFSIGFNVDIGSFCSSSGSQGTTTTGNQGTTTTTTTTSRTGNSGSLSSWLSLIF